jgi:TM2 domain-containing membrane protein YozV
MASEWYYSHGGQRHGPVSSDQLKELVASGKLRADDLIWKEGMDNWMPAGKSKKLFPGTPAAAGPASAAPARMGDVDHAPAAGMPPDISYKKLAAGLTAIQVGSLGVHKFILGRNTAGLITLLVTLLGCGVGAIVMVVIGMMEGIQYLRMTDEEFYERYLVQRKAWF